MCSCIHHGTAAGGQSGPPPHVCCHSHPLVDPSQLRPEKRGGIAFSETLSAPPRPCYQSQTSGFTPNIIHSGQIPRLAFEHAFNLPLRSFQSLMNAGISSARWAVWNGATVTQYASCDGEEENRTGREVKGERQTRHCSFMAELAEKGLPRQHLQFNERRVDYDFISLI